MKIVVYAFLIIQLYACGNSSELAEEKNPTEAPNGVAKKILINDIWVAETILGERFEPNDEKMPQLEILIKENRFGGNDGCNTIGGSLKKLDNENLLFGLVLGTKMACPDMEVPRQFNLAIAETRTYKIEKLRLYLFDKEDKELMVLKKVD